MRVLKVILIVASLGLTVSAEARDPSPKTLKLIYRVAKKHGIDAQHLIRIAAVESNFREDARRVNKNNTIDYGMFQINSIHWTTTCEEFDVMTLEGNANCAAKIVKGIEERHGETDAQWLGRYHSKTPSRKARYFRKLSSVEVTGL